jgi:hypothetical protein
MSSSIVSVNTPEDFMTVLRAADKRTFIARTHYMLKKFGNGLPCNRFATGTVNELLVRDFICKTGLRAVSNMQAKRIDMTVEGLVPFSIKYSSGGNIKLHNSLGANRDTTMVNTLLITPEHWWFLDIAEMAAVGVDYKEYLKEVADGLELKRTILTKLASKGYAHCMEVDLGLDDGEACENQSTADVFYAHICDRVPEIT